MSHSMLDYPFEKSRMLTGCLAMYGNRGTTTGVNCVQILCVFLMIPCTPQRPLSPPFKSSISYASPGVPGQ